MGQRATKRGQKVLLRNALLNITLTARSAPTLATTQSLSAIFEVPERFKRLFITTATPAPAPALLSLSLPPPFYMQPSNLAGSKCDTCGPFDLYRHSTTSTSHFKPQYSTAAGLFGGFSILLPLPSSTVPQKWILS